MPPSFTLVQDDRSVGRVSSNQSFDAGSDEGLLDAYCSSKRKSVNRHL